MTHLSPEHIQNVGDTMVRLADAEGGYVRSYILYPTMVWGEQRGVLADAGLTNVRPPALSLPVKFSIARGQGGVIGKGLNKWSHVEVHERTHTVLIGVLSLILPICRGRPLQARSRGRASRLELPKRQRRRILLRERRVHHD